MKQPQTNNLVAKHMNAFNKPTVQRDRKKEAKSGKTKHKLDYSGL